jgi:hypothetical protein
MYSPGAFARWCAVALAIGLTGCVTHEIRIDSLARPHANAASYIIRVRGATDEADSLRAHELANQVRSALGGRGLYEAPPNTKPDVIVELECGMAAPQMQPKRIPSALDRPEPLVMPSDRVQVGTDENGQPIYRKREIFRTRDGYFEMVPVYEKYLRVTARQNAATTDGNRSAEIWRIDVTTESESHDLRSALPVLVAASIDYLGTDTRGQKTIHVRDSDPAVRSVGGL